MKRRKAREIVIGGRGRAKTVRIAAGNPVAVQTMWKKAVAGLDGDGVAELCGKIEEFAAMGCDILRFAVPDMASADSLVKIAESSVLPLVADIHFDYRLALRCIEGGVAKVRINPGNIGLNEHLRQVVAAAKSCGVPLRIGVNAGSLPADLAKMLAAGEISRSAALCEAALREAEIFDAADFHDYVVSMKASSAADTVECNRAFAAKSEAPLHLGVTEAGPLVRGIVQSTAAFSALLGEGIGDTIRVSLSDTCENEIVAAKEILRVCGLKSCGAKIVSCPRCGRVGFDVHGFLARWQRRFETIEDDITIAVMGCIVNGPGEASGADIGICGANDDAVIFEKGVITERVPADKIDEVFEKSLRKCIALRK